MSLQETNSHSLYFAVDGDNIGRRHAEAILTDNPENISNISHEITAANEMIKDFVKSNGGQMISFGGDEAVFTAPADFVSLLEQLRKDYQYMTGATLSVGYGSLPSEAAKALLIAKNHGKDQVVEYNEKFESEVKGIVSEGEQSDEGSSEMPHQESQGGYNNEVASDGITRDDPPKYDNNHDYDSGYKNSDREVREDSYRQEDLTPPVIGKPNLRTKTPIKEATSADLPESNRKMNNIDANPGEQPPEDKKPVSKYYKGQAPYTKPESGAPQGMSDPNENMPSDLKYVDQKEDKATMEIEDATSDIAEETEAKDMGEDKHCPSCTCDAHSQGGSIEDVLDQHVDNAKDYTNVISEGGDQGNMGNAGDQRPEDQSIEDILDQHLDNAADMEQQNQGTVNEEGMDPQGISRPEDYNQKQNDMGLSEEEADQDEDEPQLDDVLRDGLDAHADDIHREKVINMVGDALEAFKSQKKILDKAKEQAPELYDSCLSMLKAMIELCGLAGIDQSEPEQEVNEIEGQSESPKEAPGAEEMPSEEACPNCGHQKEAAPKEGQQETPQ